MKKVLKIIGIIILILVLLVVGVIFVFSKLTAYRNAHYTENATPAGEIEKKYTVMGDMDVSYFEYDASDDTIKKFEI